ncbi:hypothetical protein VL15_21255 [Burkholderia cepacia]|uniref:Uncharacterized protein n=1 Tax=Burkholderia cepacia TaxID=292 RepID=A0A0J5WPU3_BURCE|nr:hypothetical protein VL15_21255 [Burkholderia cepacia]
MQFVATANLHRSDCTARVSTHISRTHQIDINDIFFIYGVSAQDIDIAPPTRLTVFQTGEAFNACMV